MVENLDKLTQQTASVHLTEDFRSFSKSGMWDSPILFYVDFINEIIPAKFIEKILTIIKKYRQYIHSEAIESIHFPFDDYNHLTNGVYMAILGTRKGKLPSHEKTIGSLFFYNVPKSLFLGIWPLENRYHYRNLSEKDLKSKIINELKLLAKPKLWESVLVLIATENFKLL